MKNTQGSLTKKAAFILSSKRSFQLTVKMSLGRHNLQKLKKRQNRYLNHAQMLKLGQHDQRKKENQKSA